MDPYRYLDYRSSTVYIITRDYSHCSNKYTTIIIFLLGGNSVMRYNTQRDATTVVNPDSSSLPVSSGELHASNHVQLYSQLLQKKLSGDRALL